MTFAGMRRVGAVSLCLALLVSGCGSDTAKSNADINLTGEVLKGFGARFKPKPAATAPAAQPLGVDAMAQESLRLNPGPLLFATREAVGAPTLLGMIGENGRDRTYATPEMHGMVLRRGLIVATRGLGDDMASADVDPVLALITGRHAGTGARTMRYLDGLGVEHPLPLDCQVSVAKPSTSYPFAGRSWSGTLMAEHCTGHGFDITNSYIVGGNGAVISSRQWVSPSLGYFTVQVLRP